MRIDGILTKWNDDRGFGFITPSLGGSEIFAHVSVFPKDGRRPAVGERVTFEIETDRSGKKRAIKVLCPNRPALVRGSQPFSRPRSGRGALGSLVSVVVVIALAYYGYSAYSHHKTVQRPTSIPLNDPVSSSLFRCDGRTHCSQMSSCSEAKFFLKNCPNVQMDGNNDGVPCEQQWCTSPSSK